MLVLRNENILRNSHDIDRIVTAEIPYPSDDPVVLNLVNKIMIHATYGTKNLSSPCMENSSCQEKLPKNYREMLLNLNDYPEHRKNNTSHCSN